MKRNSTKNIFIAFILNLFFSIFELIGGIFTNSVSIMADSVHDFGDALSILISLVLEKISKKKPNEDYTFGYLRYSTLGALVTSMILLVGSFFVIISASKRLVNPVLVNYDGMFILAIVGIIVNLIATKITSNTGNLNEETVSLHMFEDVLGWACVLIGSIVIKFTNWYIIDPILSIGVSLFILINVIKRFKNIFEILLEKKPSKIDVVEIKKHLLEIEEVKNVHHLHIWSIDGITNYITLHVLIGEEVLSKDLDDIKKKINAELKEHNISHSTIEFEVKKCHNGDCKISNNINFKDHIHHH